MGYHVMLNEAYRAKGKWWERIEINVMLPFHRVCGHWSLILQCCSAGSFEETSPVDLQYSALYLYCTLLIGKKLIAFSSSPFLPPFLVPLLSFFPLFSLSLTPLLPHLPFFLFLSLFLLPQTMGVASNEAEEARASSLFSVRTYARIGDVL